MRSNGSFKGEYEVAPSQMAASGVWTMNEVHRARSADVWPIAGADIYFSSVSSLLHFDNDIVDVKGHTWTNNGSGCGPTSDQSKWGGYSLFVPSSSGYLSAPHHASFGLGQVDFTVECWYRGNFSGTKTIIGKWDSPLEWIFYLNSTSLSWGGGGFSGATLADTSTTTWHHLAACRVGTTIYFLQNGSRIGSATCSLWSDSNSIMLLGQNANTNFVNGYVDDIRITKGVARYPGTTYTVPADAFPDF